MTWPGKHSCLLVLAAIAWLSAAGQAQSCPVNINFSNGNLGHWKAYTGNNKDGNGPGAIRLTYDYSNASSGPSALPEYNLPNVDGVSIITTRSTDPFGDFLTIPTINGYAYHYAILLGSTSVAQRQMDDQNGQPTTPANGPQGGYVRGISYLIDVPSGPPALPYTITYAYAMVLENGTHSSENQPMARAIISTPAGVIDCASPIYFLPTNGGLDSATARANGFTPSPVPSPNEARNPQNAGQHLQDVWTKGWTEVTFDLSPHRGQQVLLTFEADNCVPGGHFAYAYFALRDICAGLKISGDTIACKNATATYSVPSLANASYDWSTPAGWAIGSGAASSTIKVTVGPQPGWIVAREQNSCASLSDSLFVRLYSGALPNAVIDPRDTIVCYGEAVPLRALVIAGTDYSWSGGGTFSGNSKGSIPAVPTAIGVIAVPQQTAQYILNIRNEGCPVPVADSFTVTIVPPVHVNAGNDTLVVIDQPLHFQAISSDPYKSLYQWSPATNLDNPDKADPVGVYGAEFSSIVYQVTATDSIGCYGSGSVKVTIARTLPDIFVPSAFTPGKGSNSLFRPVCMGIASLDYFRVYNRWGQLVYSTSRPGQGWDGRIQGVLQETNSYLWAVRGTDYTGRVILKKGTAVLIR
ncbi:MAG: gliding motility-associated C-terminal domain-containing protein [Bacteroidetes bacterium]|nr:gliding motility-associated C-terminal domain-containing protein [Bacteroidota bacterium]